MNLLELGSELLPQKLISNNNIQNQSSNIIDNKNLSNNVIDNKDLSNNIIDNKNLSNNVINNKNLSNNVIDNKNLSNNVIDKTPLTLTSSKKSSSSNLDKSRVSFDLNKNEIINIDNDYNDNNLILSNNKINNDINNNNENNNDNDKKYIFLFIKNHFQTILFILIMIIILIPFIKYIHNHKLILNKIQE